MYLHIYSVNKFTQVRVVVWGGGFPSEQILTGACGGGGGGGWGGSKVSMW